MTGGARGTPGRRRLAVTLAMGAAVWVGIALLGATQQWAQLRGTPKHAGWVAAFLYQVPSWAMLVVLTPVVSAALGRWPLGEGRAAVRALMHGALSVMFGAVFLAVSVPVRHVFHPAPLVWDLFGAPFYKSGPQWAVLGVASYWAIAGVATLVDARARLARAGRIGTEPETVMIRTPTGDAVVRVREVRWVETRPGGGTVVHTDGGVVRCSASLGDLQETFGSGGLLRVHRSRAVPIGRVAEVVGSTHRDGWVTLDSGERVPVARRRMPELRRALESRAARA